MNDTKKTLDGGCLCGLVRYRLNGPPSKVACCHCQSCRRASGAPYVPWVTFAKKDVEFAATPPARYQSSPKATRGHCVRCGTSLTSEHDEHPDHVDITVATLDEPDTLPPAAHIWVSHKLPWVILNDGLPQYPEWRSKEESG